MTATLTTNARLFCTAAHEAVGQRRKYTGEPYYFHPYRVALLVMDVGGTEEQIAAAYLHDVVEDTDITIGTLRDEFGYVVADYVDWLTDISKPEDGNRAARKKIDREHIAKSPPEVKTIKLADLIDNTSSILQHDSKFAEVYMAEKGLLLEVLSEGDEQLYRHAKRIVEEYYEKG